MKNSPSLKDLYNKSLELEKLYEKIKETANLTVNIYNHSDDYKKYAENGIYKVSDLYVCDCDGNTAFTISTDLTIEELLVKLKELCNDTYKYGLRHLNPNLFPELPQESHSPVYEGSTFMVMDTARCGNIYYITDKSN